MPEPPELKTLVYDNTSGAREIAQQTLQLLQRHATQSSASTPPSLMDELADVAVKVLRSKPEMAPVFSAVNRFLLEAEAQESGPDLGEFRMSLVSLLQEHHARVEGAARAAAEHAASLIQNGDVVVTYSRSSTVLEALRYAKAQGKMFDVVAAESRPNLEGRTLARELAQDQLPVRLVIDALLGTAVEGADRVLVGADAITPEHVVNKAGTRLIALAAREHRVPLHVAADLAKAWVKRADPTVSLLAGKMRDPREVWDAAPLGVEVVNLYFDRTPLSQVTSLASEAGVVSPSDYWDSVRRQGYSARLRRQFADELV